MKKLHILIPSLTIASTLPALTAVSCGNQKIGEWKQSDGEFKWVHDTPKFSVTWFEAANEYFKRATNDIFADDIVKSRADAINDSDHSDYFKNWMIKVEVNEINKENCHCSFVIHESGDAELWYKNEFMHYDYTITIVDVPMALTCSEYHKWFIEVDGIWFSEEPVVSNELTLDEIYSKYKTWSFAVKGTIAGKEYDDVVNYDCLDEQDKHQDTLNVIASISCDSSFFKNVTEKEE